MENYWHDNLTHLPDMVAHALGMKATDKFVEVRQLLLLFRQGEDGFDVRPDRRLLLSEPNARPLRQGVRFAAGNWRAKLHDDEAEECDANGDHLKQAVLGLCHVEHVHANST